MKACTKCLLEQPLDNFYKKNSTQYHTQCKSCHKIRVAEYGRRNPEKKKKWSKTSFDNQDDKSTYYKRYREKHPLRVLLGFAKKRAKERGLEFCLTENDLILPDECPILKTTFEKGTDYAASIDRIDSSKGYTKDNVWIISRKANIMKSNATPVELENFSKWIQQLKI